MGQQKVRSKFMRYERLRPTGQRLKVVELIEGNVAGEPVELDDGAIGVLADGVVYVPNVGHQIELYENGELVAESASPPDQHQQPHPPRGLHALAALTLYERAQGKPTTAGRAWNKLWGRDESVQ